MLLSKAGINSTYNGTFGGASGMKSPPFGPPCQGWQCLPYGK
jgi:hypothetical protein